MYFYLELVHFKFILANGLAIKLLGKGAGYRHIFKCNATILTKKSRLDQPIGAQIDSGFVCLCGDLNIR